MHSIPLTVAQILAQASSTNNRPFIIAAVAVVAILLVFVLSRASKKSAEAPIEPDVVDTPKADGPLVDVTTITDKRLENRQVISSEDYQRLQALRDMGLLSAAQIITFNLVKQEGGVRRDTAIDSTDRNLQAHIDGTMDDLDIQDSDYELVSRILGGELKLPDAPPSEDARPVAEAVVVVPEEDDQPAEDDAPHETTIAEGLAKTNKGFGHRFKGLFAAQQDTIDDSLIDEIEEFLFTADIGSKAAEEIIGAIQEQAAHKKNPAEIWEFVREYVHQMIKNIEEPLDIEAHKPFVMLVIGVNGAGKTTTIGKLASQYKRQGKEVMIVAADTCRAAAVEQLEVWGNRADITVHSGNAEEDPASVVFAGIERGVKEGADVILCDTSGRLHNNKKLMDELARISRVSGKVLEGAPHETILVVDANMGQNAIMQAKSFNKALNISGLVLTKLDGTARGGVILAIDKELNVPVRYIGIGEGINDLRTFDADEFTDALFL